MPLGIIIDKRHISLMWLRLDIDCSDLDNLYNFHLLSVVEVGTRFPCALAGSWWWRGDPSGVTTFLGLEC